MIFIYILYIERYLLILQDIISTLYLSYIYKYIILEKIYYSTLFYYIEKASYKTSRRITY